MMYASHRLYATIVDIYGDDDVQEVADIFSDIFTAFLQWTEIPSIEQAKTIVS